MEKLINLDEYPVLPVLDILLQDKTTKENIIWATRSYIEQGEQYSDKYIITKKAIRGEHSVLIQPRVFKAEEAQAERTKKKAEVFTPSWIVNKMNNALDEEWFGQKNVFNTENDKSWITNEGKLPFGKGKTFRSYIYRRYLEITCGEAPFIISRYDAATGNLISIKDRIGILDRKLRAINENVDSEAQWIRMAKSAYKSVYGYEFQGDNLLIARINLLLTFVDYYGDRWKKQPEEKLLVEISKIIVWNFWQMDGLQQAVPMGVPETETEQLTLFDIEKEIKAPLCRIMNWSQTNSSTLFSQVGKEEDMTRKWDVIIGNPPYQEETGGDGKNNRQKPSKSIFHQFQTISDSLSKGETVFIYPGKRWIHRSGKGMADFGLQQINDPHLSKLIYYPIAQDIFPETGINDGITIVIKNNNKSSRGFRYHYISKDLDKEIFQDNPGEELLTLNPNDADIVNAITNTSKALGFKSLHERILSRSLFGIESNYVEQNKSKVELYSDSKKYNWNKKCKLYANDKGGSAGRTRLYVIDRIDIPKSRDLIDKWKVAVISANPGGQRRDNQLQLMDNHTAFGRAKVGLGVFNTKSEAENFYKYIDSNFVKYCLLMTDENLTSLAKKVPDLGDYSSSNKYIDFSKPLDCQLYSLFSLSADQSEYIDSLIIERDERRKKQNG